MVNLADKVKRARPVAPLAILAEHLQEATHLAQMEEISPELRQHLQQASHLASGLDPYLEAHVSQASEALGAIARDTQAEDWERLYAEGKASVPLEREMLSGHVEGQTLKMLVQIAGATRLLDIGLFTGYSALAMAEGLPEGGKLVACEVDSYVAEFARTRFAASPHGRKIVVELGPALDTLHRLADAGQSFDFVFIDAAKTEYAEYYRLLLERDLLAPGGIICADNTLFQGQVYLPESDRTANGDAITDFNRMVAADPRVEQVILPVRDGLTLMRRCDAVAK